MREPTEKINKSGAFSQDPVLDKKGPGKKSVKRKLFIFLIIIPVAIVLALLASWFLAGKDFRIGKEQIKESIPESETANEQILFDSSSENVETEEDSTSEENESEAGEEEIALVSENYKISQIKFGGDIVFLSDSSENVPLEIYDARSETVTSRNEEDFKLMIVWKTNKLATSKIEYSKSNGQNPKTVERDDYGFDHSIILSDLEPATAYVYRIKAKDRWNNEIVSSYFGAYTGKKADSVFELVVKAVGEVFGWAMRK